MKNCLVCDGPLTVFLDFGKQPIANGFLKKDQFRTEYFFNMGAAFCQDCTMVQLLEQPDKTQMFHENYAFFSSSSDYMAQHFALFSDTVKEIVSAKTSPLIIEIGCNDGIFLKNFLGTHYRHLGIEPSQNVANAAAERGLDVVTEFFDEALATKIIETRGFADVIVSANVMCHIPYIDKVFLGIKSALAKDGVLVFEDPYVGDILQKCSFDQIYDEHTFLFSTHSVGYLAKLHGLQLYDVEKQVTHGGSMRYFLCHDGQRKVSDRVKIQTEYEQRIGVNTLETYVRFAQKVHEIGRKLKTLLAKLKSEGNCVVAYGATSKSTTVTNFFGITDKDIDFICDTTPTKQFKYSPGAHIPVLPHDEFLNAKKHYVLLFAWNHAQEIMAKEKNHMLQSNAKWIVYVPDVEIVEP